VKTNVAILGTGNIGCDLLAKVERSPYLRCAMFAGRNLNSEGMLFAKSKGITVSDQSILALEDDPKCAEIVFDATTASSHLNHAPILRKMGSYVIDLTPSQYGMMCVPSLNMDKALRAQNVNLITCGGQATIPIISAMVDLIPGIKYVEIVASISSKSAGPGTRQNIDEFTQTTKHAIEMFCSNNRLDKLETKAIIVLNPAIPPIMMHNTIYFKVEDPDLVKVKEILDATVADIQRYVPGYRVKCGPTYQDGKMTIMIEVVGLGDYLPTYSGNLDIITCAAVTLAEEKAKELQGLTDE
jgi:acetaldehyde dehydrogenase (acetylating)